MADFTIQEYGDEGNLTLTRRVEREKKIQGLPFTVSSSIFLNNNDIDELIKVLKDYANERGNKNI